MYAVGNNKEGKNWKTTMKRIHCLEQTHFAIELFLYMISDHKIWVINHARGSNRRCLTVTYELMKKTYPAPIFQEHSQRRQDDGQQHINEGIGPSGSDRHFCCGTPTWAGEDKKVSCFSKRVRERVSLKALKQAMQLGADLCNIKLQKTAAVCS